MLIRCLDLSEKYNTRLIYLGAVSLLAKIMNAFEQPSEAYRILASVMPYVFPSDIDLTILDHRNKRSLPGSILLRDFGGKSTGYD